MTIYEQYKNKLWYMVTPVNHIPERHLGNVDYVAKSTLLNDLKKGKDPRKTNRTLDEFFLKSFDPKWTAGQDPEINTLNVGILK